MSSLRWYVTIPPDECLDVKQVRYRIPEARADFLTGTLLDRLPEIERDPCQWPGRRTYAVGRDEADRRLSS